MLLQLGLNGPESSCSNTAFHLKLGACCWPAARCHVRESAHVQVSAAIRPEEVQSATRAVGVQPRSQESQGPSAVATVAPSRWQQQWETLQQKVLLCAAAAMAAAMLIT